MNNPLAGTDPTGYEVECEGVGGTDCTMTNAKPQLEVRKDKDGKLFAVASDGQGNMVKVEAIVSGKGNGVEATVLTQGALRQIQAREPSAIGSLAQRFSDPTMQISGSNYNKELRNQLAADYFGGFAKQVAITGALALTCATTTFGAGACLAFGAGQMQAGDPSGAAFVLAGAFGAPAGAEASSLRTASQMPRGGNGLVLRDGAGATPEEMAASVGGPTGGSRVGSEQVRQQAIEDANGVFTCWRCGHQSMNPDNMHLGHRNVPASRGGNLSPQNVCLEGAACNFSAGNRGVVKPGSSCAERGSCGAPYGRSD